MSDYQQQPFVSPSSLLAIQALEERIEAESPHLTVHLFPYPFIKVRDSEHGIVVGFSSESEYVTYCQITARTEGGRHA